MRKAPTAIITVLLCWAPYAFAQKAKRPPSLPQRLYQNVHALCVGIDSFPNLVGQPGRDPTLDTPEQTATSLAKILHERYGYETKTLIGGHATKAAFEREIAKYTAILAHDDALIVYIGTHGASVNNTQLGFQGFIVPQDARIDLSNTDDYATWEREAISMQWLGAQCTKMSARHVLFLVEACFSGFMGTLGNELKVLRSHEVLATHPSRAAITGGTRHQLLVDGVFGRALLQVVEELTHPEQQRAATARELHLLIRDKVIASQGDAMRPQYRDMLVDQGEFVFIPSGVRSEEIAEQVRRSNSATAQMMGDQVTLHDLYGAFDAIDYSYATDAAGLDEIWRSRFDRFRHHAEVAGNPIAMACLYYCYVKGLGTAKDESAACHWAQEAFSTGHRVGASILAFCLASGAGSSVNLAAAERLLESAREADCPLARYDLTRSLLERANTGEIFLEDELDVLLSTSMRLAEQPWASAQLLHSRVIARLTDRVPNAISTSFALATKAHELGMPDATFELAQASLRGVPDVIPKDLQAYRRLLTRAASAGLPSAQEALGSCYKTGRHGFSRDCSLAHRWLDAAVRQDSGPALLGLADMYESGCGVPRDHEEALRLLNRAVARGMPAAMVRVGVYYLSGEHVTGDAEKAARLFRRAANIDDPTGAYLLGYCFENLLGIEGIDRDALREDKERWRATRQLYEHVAAHWYSRAASLGDATARQRLQDLYVDFFDNGSAIPTDLAGLAAQVPPIARLQKEFPKSAASLLETLRSACRSRRSIGRRPPWVRSCFSSSYQAHDNLDIGNRMPRLAGRVHWVKGPRFVDWSESEFTLLMFSTVFLTDQLRECKELMPALDVLASKFRDRRLRVIGVDTIFGFNQVTDAILSNRYFPQRDLRKVIPTTEAAYYERWGASKDYAITKDMDGYMSGVLWRANLIGLPCAILVDPTGKIAWMGEVKHKKTFLFGRGEIVEAMQGKRLDAVVEEAITGQLDLAGVHAARWLRRALQAESEGHYDCVVWLLDQYPELESNAPQRFVELKTDALFSRKHYDSDDLCSYIELVSEDVPSLWQDTRWLNAISWRLIKSGEMTTRMKKLAYLMAARANELSNSESRQILDTLGHALFLLGRVDEAVAVQRRAVELSSGSPDLHNYVQALERFELARER